MKLRHRLPLLFSSLFSLLLGIVMLTVFYLFSNFRKEEFRARLAQKAETTVRLLLQVNEVDKQLLKIIDQNTINRLYNEKTLIFNDSLQLIYSSIDDAEINWTQQDLLALKNHSEIFKQNRGYDVLGIYYPFDDKDYYVLISAEDKYGISKLNYLKVLLVGAFLTGVALVWALSFFLSKRILNPLDDLRRQMQEITTRNLKVRVQTHERNDEIQELSHSFNDMLDRIDRAYKGQKEFTANASHELRTPVARILTQLENLQLQQQDKSTASVLKSTIEDVSQLSEIITSLLVLSKVEEMEPAAAFQPVRLDETIFNAAAQLSRIYPDFRLQFDISSDSAAAPDMEVKGDGMLLHIAILNILKNAYLYSVDQVVYCDWVQHSDGFTLIVSNKGPSPAVEDPDRLFDTFTRGTNTAGKPGSGIGLSIVKRILNYHGAQLSFFVPETSLNRIHINFRKAA